MPPDEAAAQQLWEAKALPVLKTGTTPACVDCHNGTAVSLPLMMGPAYLAGGDDLGVRTTVLGFSPKIVTLDSPETSLLVTKQAHEGPALDVVQTSAILDWIAAEKTAAATP